MGPCSSTKITRNSPPRSAASRCPAERRAAPVSNACRGCCALSSTSCQTMDVRHIDHVDAFTTKDGSEIRELLAHRNSCIRKQSLAEARLPPGTATRPHYHAATEEIYYVLAGTGRMKIGDQERL